jgi:diguanylate cyclase (GGDEF)-like protein
MARMRTGVTDRIGLRAQSALGRIEVLALFPLIVLLANWFGFDDIALVSAAGLAALLACALVLPNRAIPAAGTSTPHNGKDALLMALDAVVETEGRDTVCLLIQIDDWQDLVDTWGLDAAQDLVKRTEDRLKTTLRAGDVLCRMGDARFGVVLAPMPAARLGIRDTIAARLAEVVCESLHVTGAIVRLTAGIGHASLRHRAVNRAEATIKAAEAALSAALSEGPGTIKAYADGMGRARNAASELGSEIEDAIHSGAIDAWFQPQVCARTGSLAGMEIVPRWQHHKHGLLSFDEMRLALKSSGHGHLMSQMMIHRAIEALADFDIAHVPIPEISIGLSPEALRDPRLSETVRAEVQRHALPAHRVAFEITPDATSDQATSTMLDNLAALNTLGHRIDLASATPQSVPLLAVQDFGAGRIKIDRALSLDIDTDPNKAKTVAAIVALAKAMNMQTLAVGVETVAEQDQLANLGCDHVQGFGIGRPIRIDQIPGWVRSQKSVPQPPSAKHHCAS